MVVTIDTKKLEGKLVPIVSQLCPLWLYSITE